MNEVRAEAREEARTPGGLRIVSFNKKQLRRRNWTRKEREIMRLRKENRRLNRFRNGVLWGSVYAAFPLSITLMVRATRISGHFGEIIPAFLFIAYILLFIAVNGEGEER